MHWCTPMVGYGLLCTIWRHVRSRRCLVCECGRVAFVAWPTTTLAGRLAAACGVRAGISPPRCKHTPMTRLTPRPPFTPSQILVHIALARSFTLLKTFQERWWRVNDYMLKYFFYCKTRKWLYHRLVWSQNTCFMLATILMFKITYYYDHHIIMWWIWKINEQRGIEYKQNL